MSKLNQTQTLKKSNRQQWVILSVIAVSCAFLLKRDSATPQP